MLGTFLNAEALKVSEGRREGQDHSGTGKQCPSPGETEPVLEEGLEPQPMRHTSLCRCGVLPQVPLRLGIGWWS